MPEVECVLSEEAHSLGQIVTSGTIRAAMSVALWCYVMLCDMLQCAAHAM